MGGRAPYARKRAGWWWPDRILHCISMLKLPARQSVVIYPSINPIYSCYLYRFGNCRQISENIMNQRTPPASYIDSMDHPFRSLVITIVATLFAVGALSASIYVSERRIGTFETYVIPMKELKADLRYYDVVMSQGAALFTATGAHRWELEYEQASVTLDQNMKAIKALARGTNEGIKEAIFQLDEANNKMALIERTAINLVHSEKRREAIDLLESSAYITAKNTYRNKIVYLRHAINENIHGIHREERRIALIALLIAGVMVFLVLPLVWILRVGQLKNWRSIIQHTSEVIDQSEKGLIASNATLEHSLQTTQRRGDEMRLLSEMASMLHSCATADEVFEVVKTYCVQLFPGSGGCLLRLRSSIEVLEEVGCWGDPRYKQGPFQPNECWALRRGSVYMGGIDGGMICSHHVNAHPGVRPYVCVPLAAQHDTFGLFYISLPDSSMSGHEFDVESGRRLIAAIGDNVALALANIGLRESLREQSLCDPLTGLYNRRYLEEALKREVLKSVRTAIPFAVIAFDIDHFKRFNDTYGHDAGDTVLQAVADVFKKVFRGGDVVCRLGGEEFLVILCAASVTAAQLRAEGVRAAVEKLQVNQSGAPVGPVTISGGVAAFPSNGDSVEILLKSADLALYAAKQDGRNCVRLATGLAT